MDAKGHMDHKISLQQSSEIIGNALAHLAIARGSLIDDALQSRVYLEGLIDLDPHLVERACRALGLIKREPYEPVLPSVGTIRERVEIIAKEYAEQDRRALVAPMPDDADNDPRSWIYCRDCEDNGWQTLWCPGTHAETRAKSSDRNSTLKTRACDRPNAHPAHSYARRCDCRQRNPKLNPYAYTSTLAK